MAVNLIAGVVPPASQDKASLHPPPRATSSPGSSWNKLHRRQNHSPQTPEFLGSLFQSLRWPKRPGQSLCNCPPPGSLLCLLRSLLVSGGCTCWDRGVPGKAPEFCLRHFVAALHAVLVPRRGLHPRDRGHQLRPRQAYRWHLKEPLTYVAAAAALCGGKGGRTRHLW